MRWLRVAVVLAALGVVAHVADARVPAFVRQTGLTCNQCHMSVTPAPDFTFTGMKFRINGFRTPWVAEKVEAGTEGAVNGQRLVLTLGSMLSFHARATIVQQTTPASDPALPAAVANTPTSQMINTLAMHYAGPIGEHVGVWDELYIYGGSQTGGVNAGNTHGYVGLNHYLVSFTTNVNGNIFGMQTAAYNEGSHSFFGVVGAAAPNNQLRFGTNLAGSHAAYNLFDIYAFVADRAGLLLGVQPGEDNLDWKRFDYLAYLGVFIKNTDAGWWIVDTRFVAGNDFVPLVTSLQVANDGARTIQPADAIKGVSATRASGQPFASTNTGDGKRLLIDMAGGFTDKGPHSLVLSVGQSIESETYNDGLSGAKMRAWGTTLRYYYNRTYGILLNVQGYEKRNYTDPTGVVHDIPTDANITATFIWRMSMNVNWYIAFNPGTQTAVLDQNWRNGSTWDLNFQYLW